MNSRWLVFPALTCALTLASAAGAQLPAESQPPTDPAAPVEAPPEPPPPPPEPEPAPPPPAPPPPPPPAAPAEPPAPKGHGAGTLELRLQTLTNVVSPQDALTGRSGSAAPGVSYGTDDEDFLINVSGGVGYFLSPSLALGADVGYQGNDDYSVITVAPLMKFVTGMEELAVGFVGEFSPGFVTVDTGDINLLQLTLFAGAHVPVGRSAAFVAGLNVGRLDDFDDFGEGQFSLGARYGLSVYLD